MLTALTGRPFAESRQSFSQGGSWPWSGSSMIRPATASSTRCREVFPSAGLLVLDPDLVLEPDLALGLLVVGDVVVMGRFFSFHEMPGKLC